MSRADLMRVQVMGVALAAAARDLLEGEAREEWEGPNRTRVTWNSPRLRGRRVDHEPDAGGDR
jgi:hypothetical protein